MEETKAIPEEEPSEKNSQEMAPDPAILSEQPPAPPNQPAIDEQLPTATQEQTITMETHGHHLHHAPGKKFWHYFYEFLMLFLAVFCGFLAENFREHYVEHERAKKLAKNLYEEILADSINVQQRIAVRQIKENECSYFISYVKDSSLTELSDRFFPAFSWALIQTQQLLFEPNDGIFNQLRNSGELRYFNNSELLAAIGKLSIIIANIRSRHEREYTFIENNIRPFTLKFYDFNWYEALTQQGKFELYEALRQELKPPLEGRIQNLDKFDRLDAQNITNYYLLMLRGTRKGNYSRYASANHELLQILRKEYHIK